MRDRNQRKWNLASGTLLCPCHVGVNSGLEVRGPFADLWPPSGFTGACKLREEQSYFRLARQAIEDVWSFPMLSLFQLELIKSRMCKDGGSNGHATSALNELV